MIPFVSLAAAALALLISLATLVLTIRRPKKPQEIPALPESALSALANRVTQLETAPPSEPTPAILRQSMNLNKRTLALRQHRQGRPAAEIAKNLEIPKSEVDLLVKVHRLVAL